MKYGFIGCGNMGSAIVRALATKTKDIAITDRSGKAKSIADELGITYTDTQTIAATCERIFLGVKPHMVSSCLGPIVERLAERKPVLISMAAGLTIRQIEEMVSAPLPVIRIMPNTPTAVGCGVIPYCRNRWLTDSVLEDWLSDMGNCGLLDRLDEKLMDAASALSGSGPAYLYVMLEAMADGAVACGLPRDKAMEYAAATMEGAAKYFRTGSKHPGALKDAVCSPGGSTIEGIRVLERQGFRSAAMECVCAAYEKNLKLGK